MPRKPSFDRDDLIDRARDLFWARGWAGTSMKDLERDLQLKPGSFYAAFGSKEALYALALDRYAQGSAQRIADLARELGPLDALKAQPALLLDAPSAPARACMLAKTCLELTAQDHALAQQAHSHLAAIQSAFADLFRQAQAAGDIAPHHDPDKLAQRYQSDLMGLRAMAEREDVDTAWIAQDIARDLDRL